MNMTNKKWADLIREHYDELRDTVSEQMWSCYGRVQHDILLWADGSVDIRANVGGNDTHPAEICCTIWTSCGMEYASPYDEWTEDDWIDAIRWEVGAFDGMHAFWERIVKEADADDINDYMEGAGVDYDSVSHILTHSRHFDDIMDAINEEQRRSTVSDRIEAAEDVLDRIIKNMEAWEE